MRALIIYPPRAYARMPYLAPYLLKGFIEQASEHKLDVLDINARFHYAVWSGDIYSHMDLDRITESQRQRVEILQRWGLHAFHVMRDVSSYGPEKRGLLNEANEVLYGAEQLENEISRYIGCHNPVLPEGQGEWPEVTACYKRSVAARFLTRQLEQHLYHSYQVIGLSCSYLQQLPYCCLIANILRQDLKYAGKIVIGGSGFTHIHHYTLHDSSFWHYFDYGIPYEGEVTFLELLNGLSVGNRDFEKCNVIHANDGNIQFNNRLRERPTVHPVPDFSCMEHLFPTPEPIFPLLTSKGCYWGKCAFCTHHEGYGQGYSPGTNDTIRQSIAHVAALGGSSFYFVDEALPATKIKYIAQIFSEFQSSGKIAPPKWMAECRVEKYTTNLEYLHTLKESGCRVLINGMESGSQRVLNLMKKGVDVAHAKEFVRLCRQIGIRTAWMFFIGFPGETADEAMETFKLIDECKHNLDYASVGTFALEHGSPLWNAPEQYGISEIVGRKDIYRVTYDYIADNGELHTRTNLKNKLIELYHQFPEHRDVFTRVIDRSCAMFFNEDIQSIC